MSHNLTQRYSSVVLNQNQPSNDAFTASAANEGYIQEFHLPADYRRGTESGELRYPDLSGIQLLVMIAEGHSRHAAFDYEIQYQVFGLGWVAVATGVAIGAPTDGKTWMTAYFDQPVEIDQTKATARWRIIFGGGRPLANSGEVYDVVVPYENGEANAIGTRVVVDLIMGEPYHFVHNLKNAFLYWDPTDGEVYFSYEQGLTDFLFTSPNPLALPYFDRGFDENGDVIVGDEGEGAFCFRVLALAAEDGIDFLGNQYRSVVVRNEADAINTALGADPDAYWLSKPNPSKFAVENLYFDMRKPGSTTYGRSNYATNPNFEGGTTTGWIPYIGSGGTVVLNVIADGYNGKGARVTRTVGPTNNAGIQLPTGIPLASANGTWTWSARFKMPVGRTAVLWIDWNRNGVYEFISKSVVTTGDWQRDFVTGTIPEGTISFTNCYVWLENAVLNEYWDFDDALLEESDTYDDYFDGDMEGYVWSDTPHNSRSFELIPPSAEDVSTVIDRVVVDPITPGAYFTIYYSEEGDPGLNEDEWENKLWTRIPQTYRMERRETHVLPEPIRAKYVKIEFSHLQARHYAPGNFQQSIRYKKHPKWVLDYFLARMQVDTTFLAQRVTVIYDAIDLAYNYYLDDLGQEPTTTVDVNNTALTQVTSFLSDRTDVSDRIDLVTLDKLNLALEPYRDHPALRGYATTLLGDYARQTVDTNADYAVEGARATALTSPDVSSLNRDRVVIEQSYPVMFFFLTCRHKYREIEAKFSHDRAYFAGVRQIAFLRDNYMTAFDATTYIEPAADTQNIERNEFA